MFPAPSVAGWKGDARAPLPRLITVAVFGTSPIGADKAGLKPVMLNTDPVPPELTPTI